MRSMHVWCILHLQHLCRVEITLQINHFPASFHLGRKDRLWHNLSKMQLRFGHKEFGFFPRTYILPADIAMLKLAWSGNISSQKWIIKPVSCVLLRKIPLALAFFQYDIISLELLRYIFGEKYWIFMTVYCWVELILKVSSGWLQAKVLFFACILQLCPFAHCWYNSRKTRNTAFPAFW